MSEGFVGGCLYNNLRDCVAKYPPACLCYKMHPREYVKDRRELELAAGIPPTVTEETKLWKR